MARAQAFGSSIMIQRVPEDRRRRMARLRTLALGLIGAIALSGVVLQEMHDRGSREVATGPAPFDYFPG
ncbi:MAG TPA: hypothetical protein VF138_09290 [Caulobacteraceae bacterium]